MNIRLYAVRISQPLSAAECSALARFLPPERKERSKMPEALCAYALLHHAMRSVCGWETLPALSYGEHGKPCFAADPDVHFSLSHTRGAALLAVHEKSVGADIERLRPVSKIMRARFCTESDEDFWRFWVQRESRCKRAGISAVALRDREVPPVSNERLFLFDPFPNYTASISTCSNANADKLICLTAKELM